jgi:hypothetical protein
LNGIEWNLCGGVVDAEGNKSLLCFEEEFAKICCGLWKYKNLCELWKNVKKVPKSVVGVEESAKNFVGCGRT